MSYYKLKSKKMVSLTVILALLLAAVDHVSFIRAEEFGDDDS